jgi:hypothetical protein
MMVHGLFSFGHCQATNPKTLAIAALHVNSASTMNG